MSELDKIVNQQKEILDRLNALFPSEESEETEIYVEPPLSTPELVAMCYNAFIVVNSIEPEEQDKMTQVALNRLSH